MINFITISAPSGSGKTTLCKALQLVEPEIEWSISYTTREKRSIEEDGVDYFFVSENKFNELIKDDFFIEYEMYGTDYYGTGKNQITNAAITVLDVEVNGATKLLEENTEFIGIFIDIDDTELINRLLSRGHDESFIEKRMKLAKEQRSKIDKFDFVVKLSLIHI